MQNDDAFFHVVEDLVVTDAHDFSLNKNHAHLCYDDVDREELKELDYAHAEDLDDEQSSDLVAIEDAFRENVRQMHAQDARYRRIEVKVVQYEDNNQLFLHIVDSFQPHGMR